jgi:trk system potassium uptake protein TrkH
VIANTFPITAMGSTSIRSGRTSLFPAVTPRTAGFHTVDTASLTDLSLFITIILVFVGASRATTGGGVKRSTGALLALSIGALLKY